jgi:hypothetical protein
MNNLIRLSKINDAVDFCNCAQLFFQSMFELPEKNSGRINFNNSQPFKSKMTWTK